MSSRLTKKVMKNLLDNTAAAVKNSRNNASLLEKVKEFGYTAESFQTAEDLHSEAEKLFLAKGPKAGRKVSLSMQLKEKIDELHSLFMVYVKLLRRDLRDDPALFREFNLEGPRDDTVSGRVKEPQGFYKNCLGNEKLAAFVSKYGLTKEKLESQLQAAAEIETDAQFRALSVKESEKATADRNRAFQKLKDWWHNYKTVLTFIFKDDPQQLEAFNIKAYSPGYRPARNRETGSAAEIPQPVKN